ncbi:MAG: ADP-ribose pyrophosphatase [Actinomycetia bacterium]|nr:ADP-ribose pyrophosphatase [Actinomycetes bacterium]
MTDMRTWNAEETVPTPAATVILLRDSPAGIETLMLHRNTKLAFAGGAWVFPGGKVEPEDFDPAHPDDTQIAARNAAVREAMEEADLAVDVDALVPFAHWMPPASAPKRFATWFFLAPTPAGAVTIDGSEIHDHAWMRPETALQRRDALEVELIPPTWVTLHWLSQFATMAEAVAAASAADVEYFVTHFMPVEGGVVSMWAQDAGYDTSDPDVPGPRHRLWMLDSGWRYERSPG